jgi:hypothetical protein
MRENATRPIRRTSLSAASSLRWTIDDFESGETYFVQGTVRMGIYAGRPKFTVVDEARARTAIAKIKQG